MPASTSSSVKRGTKKLDVAAMLDASRTVLPPAARPVLPFGLAGDPTASAAPVAPTVAPAPAVPAIVPPASVPAAPATPAPIAPAISSALMVSQKTEKKARLSVEVDDDFLSAILPRLTPLIGARARREKSVMPTEVVAFAMQLAMLQMPKLTDEEVRLAWAASCNRKSEKLIARRVTSMLATLQGHGRTGQ